MRTQKKKGLLRFALFLTAVALLWVCVFATAVAADGDEAVEGISVSGLSVTHTTNGHLQMWEGTGDGFMGADMSVMLSQAGGMLGEQNAGYASMANVNTCLGAALEIIVEAPKDTLKFTNELDKPAVLSFNYGLLLANNGDVRFPHSQVASRTGKVATTVAAISATLKAMSGGQVDMMNMLGINETGGQTPALQQTEQGRVEVLLQPGETYYVPIECANQNLSAGVISVSGITLTEMDTRDVSFQPAEGNTPYSIWTADGATQLAAVSNEAQTVTVPNATGVMVKFDRNNGKLGYWLDGNGRVLDSCDPAGDSVIVRGQAAQMKPAFVPVSAVRAYEANGIRFYGWDEAFAGAGSNGIVTLALQSYVMPQGTYTIPSGSMFVVPHTPRVLGNDADGNPVLAYSAQSGDATLATPNKAAQPYAQLWAGEGVHISIPAGAELLVNAQLITQSGTQGEPGNGFGVIYLDGTMQVNGKLTARGFIAQSNYTSKVSDPAQNPLIHVSDGAEVNVVFQILDYRGGNATVNAVTSGAMPISIYSFCNVMVKTEYAQGAQFSAYCTIAVEDEASGMKIVPHTVVTVIDKETYETDSEGNQNLVTKGLFSMGESAVIVTDYQYEGDRFIFNVESGSIHMNFIKIPVLEGTLELSTADFELPLHDGMVVNLNGDSQAILDWKVKLLPGAEINVGEDATLNLNNNLYLFAREDYSNAYAYNKLRLRPNASVFENAGKVTSPENDAVVKVAGQLVLGDYTGLGASSGKLLLSEHHKGIQGAVGASGESKASFLIPAQKYIEIYNANSDKTTETTGGGQNATTVSTEGWKPVSGLIGGMSENANDPKSFYDEDLSKTPAEGGDTYKAALVGEGDDAAVYWYRYTIDYVDAATGETIVKHYAAPAYDTLTAEDLNYNGLQHVVTGIAVTDTESNAISANDAGSTNMTYYGLVEADETHYTDLSAYAKAWETLKLSGLNLTNVDETKKTDIVVTLNTQDVGHRVYWTILGDEEQVVDSWLSYSKADGSIDYLKAGSSFGIAESTVTTKSGTDLSDTVQIQSVTRSLDEGGTAVELSSSAPISEDVNITLRTQTDSLHVTFVYPDETTQEADIITDAGHCGIEIPQDEDRWLVVDKLADVEQTGMTVDSIGETVELSWTGSTAGTGAVTLHLTAYDHKISYTVNNGDEDGALLSFDPVYTNEDSFTQSNTALKVNGAAGPKYYFTEYKTNGSNDGTKLTTENLSYDTQVATTMKAYDSEVIIYNTVDDSKVYVDYVTNGSASYYELEEGYAWDQALVINASGSVADCVNATADSSAKLGFSAVNGNAYINAHIVPYDFIVTFTDGANELGKAYVTTAGDASYTAPDGQVIIACQSEPAAEFHHFDSYDKLTNAISDGWEGISLKNIQADTTAALTLRGYERKITWNDHMEDPDGELVGTQVDYLSAEETVSDHLPTDGYVFATDAYRRYSSSVAGGSADISFDMTTESCVLSNISYDWAVLNVSVGEYAHKVIFRDAVTGDTLKSVIANADGKDISDPENNPYFAYGQTLKTFIGGIGELPTGVSVNGTETINVDGADTPVRSRVEVLAMGENKDVVIDITPLTYRHILTVVYQDKYSSTTEQIYATQDEFTKTYTPEDHLKVIGISGITGDPGVAYDDNSFTVTMGEGNAKVEVQIRSTEIRFTKENNVDVLATRTKILSADKIEVTDGAYGVFTVESTYPCVVALDNGNGDFTRLTANQVGTNKYEFDLSAVDNDFSSNARVVVAIKGDYDLDGRVNNADVLGMKLYILGKLKDTPPSSEQILAADVAAKIGKINSADVLMVKLLILGRSGSVVW